MSKQIGKKTSASPHAAPTAETRWDRRYFVMPPGRTSLRYYRTREDYVARKEPSGAIDTAQCSLQVCRQPLTHPPDGR